MEQTLLENRTRGRYWVAESDVIGLRLYVEENNKRAQHTYEELGMVKPGYLVMESMLANNTKKPSGEK